MRRKNLMTALLCAAVVAASTVMAPGVVMAEETEAVTEAVTEASTEAATEADTEALTEASTEEALELAERPDYKALDYVELGEYKGLTVEVEPTAISDDEVLKQIRANAGSDILEEVTEGTVEEGDTANIDYEGKTDGKAFEGGSASGSAITLGSSGFIDGFDDGVIGMKPGETKDLNLKFPDDYPNSKDLAGKAAVFTVTLNYISKTNTPKLTDKLVSEKTEYKTIEEYKKSIVDDLKKQKKDSAGSTAYGQVEDKAEVKKYPESIVNTATSQLDAYYRYTAKQYGFDDFNTFLTQSGMTEDTYNVELKKAAQSVAKTQLLTEAIAEKEGITVTDDEITKEMQKVEEQGGTVDELKKNFKELYGDVISIEKYYKITLLTNKVIDMIGENAKIKE